MSPKRVLVVDDEPTILFCMREFLGARGFLVEGAGDAGEALSRLRRRGFDLLITDLRLDDRGADGGLEVVELGRRLHPEMHVIVLTACDCTFEQKALDRGADSFLQKPQPLDRILDLAESLLAKPGLGPGGGPPRPAGGLSR